MAAIGVAERLLSLCERVFHALAVLCLAIMLIINMINISSRATLGYGLKSTLSWSTVLFVWLTFFGFFVLYHRRRDITIDFLVNLFGKSGQAASRLLTDIVTAGLMVLMLSLAPATLASQVGGVPLAEIGGSEIPRFTLSIPLFASCALILVEYLTDFMRRLIQPNQNFL